MSIYVSEELIKKFKDFFIKAEGNLRLGNSNIIDTLKLIFDEEEIHTHILLKDISSTFYLMKEKFTKEERELLRKSPWFPELRLNVKHPTAFDVLYFKQSPNSDWGAYLRINRRAFLIYKGNEYLTELKLSYKVVSYCLWRDYLVLIDEDKNLRVFYLFSLKEIDLKKGEGFEKVFSDKERIYLRYENGVVQAFTVGEARIEFGSIVQDATTPEGTVVETGKGEYAYTHSISFSPDGKYLAVVAPEGVFVSSTDSLNFKRVVLNERVWTARFSPDGKYLAIGTQYGYVCILDTLKWREVELCSMSGEISLSFSRNGKWLAVADKENLSIYKVGSWEEQFAKSLWYTPLDIAFDFAGEYIAVGSVSGCRIYNIRTGAEVVNFEDYTEVSYNRTISFSSEGTYIAYSSKDSSIKIRFVEDWEEVEIVAGEMCVFSSDGRFLFTTSKDEVIVYYTDGFEKIESFVPYKGKKILDFDVSSDCRYLACGYDDGSCGFVRLNYAPPIERNVHKLRKSLWIDPYLLFVDENQEAFIWKSDGGDFSYKGSIGRIEPSKEFKTLKGIEGWRIGKDFVLLADSKVAGSKGFQKHVNVLLGGIKADFESFKGIIMKNVLEMLK